MRDLDKTVAYDLRDLSDEQLNELLNWLIKNDKNWSCFTPIELKNETVYYLEEEKQWLFYCSNANVVNALTLFETGFKQGDKVLVRNLEDEDWSKRVYVVEHNLKHYVETYDGYGLFSYRYIKPYEDQKKWYKLTKGKYLSYDRLTETDRLEVDSLYAIEEITDPEFIKHLDANAN